jgi:hypothetical protein
MNAGPKRPRTITIVLWGLILVGLWEGGKVVALTRQLRLLLELETSPDPRLRLVMAGVWTVMLLSTAVALWARKPFARWLVPGLLLVYVVYQFVLVALSVRVSGGTANWLLDVLLATAVLLYCTWALNRETATSYYVEEESRPAA